MLLWTPLEIVQGKAGSSLFTLTIFQWCIFFLIVSRPVTKLYRFHPCKYYIRIWRILWSICFVQRKFFYFRNWNQVFLRSKWNKTRQDARSVLRSLISLEQCLKMLQHHPIENNVFNFFFRTLRYLFCCLQQNVKDRWSDNEIVRSRVVRWGF